MSDYLRPFEEETLARGWPWSFAQVEQASRVAEVAGWRVPQLIGFLDGIAMCRVAEPAEAVRIAAYASLELAR